MVYTYKFRGTQGNNYYRALLVSTADMVRAAIMATCKEDDNDEATRGKIFAR